MALYLVLGCPALLLLGAFLLRRWPTPPPALRRHLPDVYLEGNIGAGKSTLATALASTGNYDVYQEPIEEWRGTGGVNFLAALMNDYAANAYLFQVLVLGTLCNRMRCARRTSRMRIFERSARCAVDVFSEHAHAVGAISRMEMVTLRVLRDATRPAHPVVYLYVRIEPEEARRRTQRRGRPEESQLPHYFFARLHRRLDDWLLRAEYSERRNEVVVLDGTLSPEDLLAAALEALERVCLYAA
ncbi:thymidine kinase 2, mitochondrial-like [Frankliniella occidentalis]|uniref:Thymidine kinase 2, mitochondrial-like n=1 Tax=Frankliniella occidentalis TaxID=133901 RepID=A0A6J1T4R3_FRAOC|nr:thymidine kinase 2, mitochondrial-like [Frankliniella occidentalis]